MEEVLVGRVDRRGREIVVVASVDRWEGVLVVGGGGMCGLGGVLLARTRVGLGLVTSEGDAAEVGSKVEVGDGESKLSVSEVRD